MSTTQRLQRNTADACEKTPGSCATTVRQKTKYRWHLGTLKEPGRYENIARGYDMTSVRSQRRGAEEGAAVLYTTTVGACTWLRKNDDDKTKNLRHATPTNRQPRIKIQKPTNNHQKYSLEKTLLTHPSVLWYPRDGKSKKSAGMSTNPRLSTSKPCSPRAPPSPLSGTQLVLFLALDNGR